MNLESDLLQFSGGGDQYWHWTKRLRYTEGVRYLAETAGAYWLIDAIASYQGTKKLRTERLREFQLWQLTVKDKKAVLTCREDDGEPAAVRQKIEFTDFPLDEIKLYVESGDGLVLMLPGER